MTFGTALRTARQARGLSLADITAQTKIRSEYLEAIEAERLSALPERALVRSFVQTYAAKVGLDAAPLLADLDTRLPPPPTGQLPGSLPPQLNGTTQDLANPARRRAVLPLPTLLAGLLVLGAGGYAWWSGRSAPTAQAPAVAPATQVTPAQPAPPRTFHLTVNSVPAGARVLLDNRELGQTPLASFPVEGRQSMVLRVEYGDLLPFKQKIDLRQSRNLRVQLRPQGQGPSRMTDVVTGKVQDSLPVAAPKAPAGTAKTGVNLSFSADSWVRVTSPRGNVLYEGILPAGTQRHYDKGITLRVGNAGAVQVSVDGSPPQSLGGAGEALTRTY